MPHDLNAGSPKGGRLRFPPPEHESSLPGPLVLTLFLPMVDLGIGVDAPFFLVPKLAMQGCENDFTNFFPLPCTLPDVNCIQSHLTVACFRTEEKS